MSPTSIFGNRTRQHPLEASASRTLIFTSEGYTGPVANLTAGPLRTPRALNERAARLRRVLLAGLKTRLSGRIYAGPGFPLSRHGSEYALTLIRRPATMNELTHDRPLRPSLLMDVIIVGHQLKACDLGRHYRGLNSVSRAKQAGAQKLQYA